MFATGVTESPVCGARRWKLTAKDTTRSKDAVVSSSLNRDVGGGCDGVVVVFESGVRVVFYDITVAADADQTMLQPAVVRGTHRPMRVEVGSGVLSVEAGNVCNFRAPSSIRGWASGGGSGIIAIGPKYLRALSIVPPPILPPPQPSSQKKAIVVRDDERLFYDFMRVATHHHRNVGGETKRRGGASSAAI